MPIQTILENKTQTQGLPSNDHFFMLDKLEIPYFVSNSSGIISVSGSLSNLLDIDSQSLLGKRTLSDLKKVVNTENETVKNSDHPNVVALNSLEHQRNVEFGIYKTEDQIVWVSLDSILIKENDSPFVLTTVKDISKYKRLQSEINMYKEAISSVSYHVLIANSEGNVLFANNAAEKATGFAAEEILGKNIKDARLWGGQMQDSFYKEMWHSLNDLRQPFEAEVMNQRKNGEKYTALLHVEPVTNLRKEIIYFVSIEVDISVYKEIEAIKDQLETFFELSLDMLCIANTGGRFEKINESFERILGWSKEELLSNSILEYVHKDDIQNTYEMIGNLFVGKQIVNFENRYRCKDGSYKWLSWNIKPLDDGKLFASVRDITIEKQIDRMKTEFISMASHQLRTPLSSIRWYSEMLNSHVYRKLEVKEQKYLMKIQHANLRMINLVSTLLNISRTESGRLIVDPKEVNLRNLIESLTEELILKAHAKDQDIKINYQSNKDTYMLDDNVLRNVLMNLLTNAIKYSDNGKTIEIKVTENKENLGICVIDEGYGIPQEDIDKVFTKFFRSANIVELVTEGTGLGLYLVKELIEMSGGNIEFTSKLGKGSTFCVILPLDGMVKKSGEVVLGS